MDYVINPWWFYWIEVVHGLRAMFIIITAFGMVFGASTTGCGFADGDNKVIALGKKLLLLGLVGWIGIVFVPSKYTLYKMLIASQVTTQRVEAAGELADKAFDKIVDKIVEGAIKVKEAEK